MSRRKPTVSAHFRAQDSAEKAKRKKLRKENKELAIEHAETYTTTLKKEVERSWLPANSDLNEACCELTRTIKKKASNLDIADYSTALGWVYASHSQWVRDPKDWKPKGKGRLRLFRSLCNHLLAPLRRKA